jgi:hypothetical protein
MNYLKTTHPFDAVDFALYSDWSLAESLSYLSIEIGVNQTVFDLFPAIIGFAYAFLFSSTSASQDSTSNAFCLSSLHLEADTIASISSFRSFAVALDL